MIIHAIKWFLNITNLLNVATLITALSTLVAAFAVFRQLHFARFSTGVSLLLQLRDNFDGPELRKKKGTPQQT
jgi:hypothetical protein